MSKLLNYFDGCATDVGDGIVTAGAVALAAMLALWLTGCVETDPHGFVCTGLSSALPLETSRPGVFAIGDVRSGSVKRVAAGVGEGAAVVAQIHQALAAQQEGASA